MSDISPTTIGLLIDWLDSDYSSSLAFACHDEVRSRGMRFVCFVGHGLDAAGEPLEAGNLAYQLATSGVVGGLVVASLGNAASPDDQASYLARYRSIPMCTLSLACEGTPCISVDNAAGMRDAVSHLISVHGLSRVAFVRGPETTPDAEQRFEGYRRALELHGVAFDEALVVQGDFTSESGARAVGVLMDERGVDFDALVAANDAMAVAASSLLSMRGRRVPEDVAVCGFDDVEEARFANPPISSVRQPWRARARRAVDVLVRQMRGEVTLGATVAAEFVPRPSCGCGARFAAPHSPAGLGAEVRSWDWRKATALAVSSELSLHGSQLSAASARALVECLWQQVTSQREGGFLLLLEQELTRRLGQRASLSAWHYALSRLRADVLPRVSQALETAAVESLMHSAFERVGHAVERQQALRRLEFERQGHLLALGGPSTNTAFTLRGLASALEEQLPELGIDNYFVCRYEPSTDPFPHRSKVLVARNRRDENPATTDFDTLDLLPADAWPDDRESAFVLESLHFQGQTLGHALFQIGPRQGEIYVALRQQLSAALAGQALVQQVEERAHQREQAERARMQEEIRIARQVQVSILPVEPRLPFMELSSALSPGQLGGADYFDVRADDGGAWLCVGSSRGRGFGAGLIVPMLHSTVAAVCHALPGDEPVRLLELVLSVMKEHLESRVRERYYVNLLLARFESDGRVRFVGDHSGIAVCSWHGAAGPPGASVLGYSPEGEPLLGGEFRMSPHDLVLLYSQGLTRSSDFEDAPIDGARVARELEKRRTESVDSIRDGVLNLVERWTGKRADLSVIVGRRLGPR